MQPVHFVVVWTKKIHNVPWYKFSCDWNCKVNFYSV